jgi:hypothetical protein
MNVLISALDDDPEDAAFTGRVIDKILADHLANTLRRHALGVPWPGRCGPAWRTWRMARRA